MKFLKLNSLCVKITTACNIAVLQIPLLLNFSKD